MVIIPYYIALREGADPEEAGAFLMRITIEPTLVPSVVDNRGGRICLGLSPRNWPEFNKYWIIEE